MQPDVADRGLPAVTRVALGAVIVLPNLMGALVVLVLAIWVLPNASFAAPYSLVRNLTVAVGYAAFAVVIGMVWGWARTRVPPLRSTHPRDLTRHRARIRRVVLRGPVRLSTVQAVLWIGGVVLFVLLNVFSSAKLATSVGLTVALGGITTVAITYRLSERVLRSQVARVLKEGPPADTLLPGVTLRSIGGWAMGTAVPVLGVCLAAVAALVTGGYSTRRLAWVVIILSVVALIAGGFVTALTASSTAAPVLAVRRAQRRVQSGDYDAEVAVFDTTELGLLQAGFNTMVEGLRERARVRELFGRHVGEDVARTALENDLELGGESRQLAVLFVDVVGSTALAASHPPHEVVEQLNAFFAIVVDVVEHHGGWINKFEGDAALAVFGAPIDIDDAAGRALRAGRELGERLAAELTDVRAGIGVSAGLAVAGNIGDTRRYEYTVIGDPVNEAARLTELAKDLTGAIAASGAALARTTADEAARWTVIGSRHLRGREGDTDVAVPTERAATSGAAARRGGTASGSGRSTARLEPSG